MYTVTVQPACTLAPALYCPSWWSQHHAAAALKKKKNPVDIVYWSYSIVVSSTRTPNDVYGVCVHNVLNRFLLLCIIHLKVAKMLR